MAGVSSVDGPAEVRSDGGEQKNRQMRRRRRRVRWPSKVIATKINAPKKRIKTAAPVGLHTGEGRGRGGGSSTPEESSLSRSLPSEQLGNLPAAIAFDVDSSLDGPVLRFPRSLSLPVHATFFFSFRFPILISTRPGRRRSPPFS